MFCVYCGAQIPKDSVFCEKCGRRQPASDVPETVPVAEPSPMVEPVIVCESIPEPIREESARATKKSASMDSAAGALLADVLLLISGGIGGYFIAQYTAGGWEIVTVLVVIYAAGTIAAMAMPMMAVFKGWVGKGESHIRFIVKAVASTALNLLSAVLVSLLSETVGWLEDNAVPQALISLALAAIVTAVVRRMYRTGWANG